MKECKVCGKLFIGNVCPDCQTVYSVDYTCPICGTDLASKPEFCPSCGFNAYSMFFNRSVLDYSGNRKYEGCSEIKHRDSGGLDLEDRNDGYYVVGIGSCTDEDVYIPALYDSFPVVGIADKAFKDCRKIHSVHLSKNIDSIGKFSFSGCTFLETIDFPDIMTSVGSCAFKDCEGIKDIRLPDRVEYIGESAFENCKSLEYIKLSQKLTSIKSATFKGCIHLTIVNLPNGVSDIGNSAFLDCISLQYVDLPKSVRFIGDRAFENCKSLAMISIPELVTQIGTYAFMGCENILQITIPEGIRLIRASVFRGCTRLENIFIPVSVTEIGYDAFGGCISLHSIRYQGSQEEFKKIIYPYGDDILRNIKFECDQDGSCHHVDGHPTDDTLINSKIPVIKVQCDGYVLVLRPLFGQFACCTCFGVESVVNPNVSVPHVIQGFLITGIDDSAFAHCEDISTMEISEGVEYISANAFFGCASLTTVKIPESVKKIGKDAFKECKALKKVIIENLSSWCEILFENEYANPLFYAKKLYDGSQIVRYLFGYGFKKLTRVGQYAFYNCSTIASVELTKGIQTEIGDCAFSHCSSLWDVELSNGITTIGSKAFEYCKSLREIKIPQSIKHIGEDAFLSCTSLSRVIIKDLSAWCGINFENFGSNPVSCTGSLYLKSRLLKNITVSNDIISNYAFYNCLSLESVVIEKEVSEIGRYSFSGCKSLVSVKFTDASRRIDDEAFSGCSALKDVDFGEGLTYIGICSFSYCTTLSQIILPSSVKSVSSMAFSHCESISSVFIPKFVETVDNLAFYECNHLKDVYYEGTLENWNTKKIDLTCNSSAKTIIHYSANLDSLK